MWIAAADGIIARFAIESVARVICATEALLVRVPADESQSPKCHLVPIDACCEFVGRLRMLWHGGPEVSKYIDGFVDLVRARSQAVAR